MKLSNLVVTIALLLICNNLKAQNNLAKHSLVQLEALYQQKITEGKFQEAQPYILAMLQKGEELDKKDTAYAKILYHAANVQEYLGAIDSAMTYLEGAINIQKIKIPQHADYAKSIHLLGILYRNKGDYAQAEKFYTQAMNIRKTALGENHKDYASSLNNLGNLYYDLGDYAKAEKFQLQALDIRKSILGEKHPEYAINLNNLGLLYLYMGDYEKAESYCSKGLSIQKEVLGENHKDYAASLNNLGLLYDYMGDYKQSKVYYNKALNIQKTALGEMSPDYAASLDNIGIFYNRIGEYANAENAYLQVFNIRQKALGKSHPDCAKTLHNLANLYTALGDYPKAESFLLQALEIKKEIYGEKHPEYASSLANLGLIYYNLGDYVKAENVYQQALTIEKEVLGEKHPDYAKSLNNLAMLYNEKKDYAKAESFYQQALAIEKEVLGEMHPDYAKSLNNLAVLYSDQGNYNSAEIFYLKVLDVRKKALGMQHPDYANSLNNLGTLYYNWNDYEKSKNYYSQALNLYKEILGEKHPDYAAGLNNLAALYEDKNQSDFAWQQVLAAIYSNSDLTMSNNITANWTDSLATANYVSLNNINRSLIVIYDLLASNPSLAQTQQRFICNLALELLKRNKNELADDEDKLRILAQNNEWVLKSIKVMDKNKDAAKALEIAEQNKSVLLLDAASNKNAYLAGLLPDSLIQKETELYQRYANIQAALIQEKSEAQRNEIRAMLTDLNLEIDAFQKEIKKNFPKYAAFKYQYEPIQTLEIQKQLADKTALLEYLIGDSIVYIFYVDKKQVKLHEFAVSNETLKKRIHDLHKALSNYNQVTTNAELAYRAYTQEAYWFYKNLVQPALVNAKDIKDLIIVTDGELGHLPFEVFLVEAAPQKTTAYKNLHYMIQDYNISYNYSATLFAASNVSTNKRKNNGQILGIASNYEISLHPSKTSLRLPTNLRIRAGLNPLPAARKEVEDLSNNFSGFFAFDKEATEKFFKQHAAEYGVIHLAMHGLLNKREAMLSSLAFTEDSDSLENNFLHVYEIAKMDLNADLVVLSACETGIGKFETGNGIASLSRAFMYAGVPSLVVSLWQVNDFATAKIMTSFYQNLVAGMKKDEALKKAKMDYLQSATGVLAHPAFWSPFIQMGHTESIVISGKSSSWGWMLGIGALAVLGIGVFAFLKK